MFRKYMVKLTIRICLIAVAIFLFITDPEQLDITSHFGFSQGIDFVDIVFFFLFADMLTKLIPTAKIAIGSKKQWGSFHKPTASTVDDQVRDVISSITNENENENENENISGSDTANRANIELELVACYQGEQQHPTCLSCTADCPHRPANGTIRSSMPTLSEIRNKLSDIEWLQSLPNQVSASIEELFKEHIARPAAESAKGIQALSNQVARQLSVVSGTEIDDGLLSADEEMRDSIRENRVKEIVPVIVVWVLFNALVTMILLYLDILGPATCLLWTLFYFVADMICVVAWCPFQVLLMRNRCCTTCQIFNWDAIMAVTPLLFVPCLFSWLLLGIALVVLIRWEVAFLRNPERFDERTNASLVCLNCQDKLCVVRRPLRNKEKMSQ